MILSICFALAATASTIWRFDSNCFQNTSKIISSVVILQSKLKALICLSDQSLAVYQQKTNEKNKIYPISATTCGYSLGVFS